SNNSSIAKPPFSFYHTRKRGFVHNLFTHAFVLTTMVPHQSREEIASRHAAYIDAPEPEKPDLDF
ncbi:MAG: hypothetical protein KH441_13520, partial [Clostridium sp.]|nr:hypothetical protein [Clostridium sp.]